MYILLNGTVFYCLVRKKYLKMDKKRRLCQMRLTFVQFRQVLNVVEPFRQVRVAVIGTPNVGKSSLTNKLIKNDICAVSRVIDTTRQNWVTTLKEGTMQLTVVDSPGLVATSHAKKVINTHSESKILVDPEKAFRSAQHVLVVHDVTAPGEFIHHRVLHLLHRNSHIPSSLVLNKCDLIKDRPKLLELVNILTNGFTNGVPIRTEPTKMGKLGKKVAQIETKLTINPLVNLMEGRSDSWKEDYNKVINKATHKCSWQDTKKVFLNEKGWPHFQNVFYVSCKTGEGIQSLREQLFSFADSTSDNYVEEGGPMFRQKPHVIVAEHVRSTLLNSLPADVAYQLKPVVSDFEHIGTSINVVVDVVCEKKRWANMINNVVNKEKMLLASHFSKLFQCPVSLQIHPKFNGKLVLSEE